MAAGLGGSVGSACPRASSRGWLWGWEIQGRCPPCSAFCSCAAPPAASSLPSPTCCHLLGSSIKCSSVKSISSRISPKPAVFPWRIPPQVSLQGDFSTHRKLGMRLEGQGALSFVLPLPKYPFPLPNHSYISSRWWARYVTEQKAWLQNLAKSGSSPDKAKQLIFVVFVPPCSTSGLEAGVILAGEIRGNLPRLLITCWRSCGEAGRREMAGARRGAPAAASPPGPLAQPHPSENPHLVLPWTKNHPATGTEGLKPPLCCDNSTPETFGAPQRSSVFGACCISTQRSGVLQGEQKHLPFEGVLKPGGRAEKSTGKHRRSRSSWGLCWSLGAGCGHALLVL